MPTTLPPYSLLEWDGPHAYPVPDMDAITQAIADAGELAEARRGLEDLHSFVTHLATYGSRENARLQRNPTPVAQSIADELAAILALLPAADPCPHGFASSCPEGCN